MYQVQIEHKTSKDIESLPKKIIQSIYDIIVSLKINPRPIGVKKLIGQNGWRIRHGDYRILYTIDDKVRIVKVYKVKHRKDVYR